MGQFKMEITAVGGHGCKREPKEGERVYGCRRLDCPDCFFADVCERLRRFGAGPNIDRATFTHWPGTPAEVVDEVKIAAWGGAEVTRIKGQFVYDITINGAPRTVQDSRLTYDQIVVMAKLRDPAVPPVPGDLVTITCFDPAGGAGHGVGFCVAPGETVAVRDGLVISAVRTGAA